MQRPGLHPNQPAVGKSSTVDLLTSSPSLPPPSIAPIPRWSIAEGRTSSVISNSFASVVSGPSKRDVGDGFSMIYDPVNPPPPPSIFAPTTCRPKEAPWFVGSSTGDIQNWTTLVRHYLPLMAGGGAQRVAYTETLLFEANNPELNL